jgi:hypothetical protein
MELTGLSDPGFRRCAKLRWKGLQIDSVPDPNIQPSNDRAFWCQHTFKPVGPDGQCVDELDCVPGRACFEEL